MSNLDNTNTNNNYSVNVQDNRTSLTNPITDIPASRAPKIPLTIKDLTLNGFLSQSSLVANFRNIQYARIPARWHQAVPVDLTQESGTIDATQWGPRAPQPVDVLHDATRHLYPRMATWDRQSEFECLGLNVCAPREVVAGGKGGRGRKRALLPVLVWVHGGAFVFGDGGCEFDGQYLVRRSIDLGEPILVVGFNYRLGLLGFLGCKELRAEARSRGEPGFNNLGLHDQRLALQWIQHHIHHFGGDGTRITVAGESAGAISIIAHLRGTIPLFQNAFLMSPAVLQPEPEHEVQNIYNQMVQKLGLSDVPTGQQLSALRSLSPQALHDLLAQDVATLCADAAFFTDYTDEKWEDMAALPSWTHRIVVGQTSDETILFSQRWTAMSASALLAEWRALYADNPLYAQEVFSAYNVSEASTQEEVVKACVRYTTDAAFGKAVAGIAFTHLLTPPLPGDPKVYLYTFGQPDIIIPNPNPIFRVGAYHSQDNSFLFFFPQVAGPDAPAAFRATAEAFSAAALNVVNGKEPWEDVGVRRRFMRFDGDQTGVREEGEGSWVRWKVLVGEGREGLLLRGRDLMVSAMGEGMRGSVGSD
ncbi:alpha/beta-hydrolase [Byssothecium circinans]|uniref:Carboxylic ester hydrolase n=1 Tax=Byssothecium circinans TaxID=147558 RepID=A0A6A5TNP5_9PLEO|nr:alpha/beta-hydrolase [Byssothecium circinans]